MKKLILTTIVLAFALTTALAQKPAQIKFEKTTHDFGSFSETNPKVTCVFAFENVGEQPLVINQAIASILTLSMTAEVSDCTAKDRSPADVYGVDDTIF